MKKNGVRARILLAEPDAFLRACGVIARSALAITPVKCQNVLLFAALQSQQPFFIQLSLFFWESAPALQGTESSRYKANSRIGPLSMKQRNEYMFKSVVTYCLIFIVCLTVYQWLFRPEIDWVTNIGMTILAFFIAIFVEWISNSNKKTGN